MTEPFCLSQLISFTSDGCKLKALGALIVEERDLAVVRATGPAACHDIWNRPDLRIVDLAQRRSRHLFHLFLCSGKIGEHAVASADGIRRRIVHHEGRASET